MIIEHHSAGNIVSSRHCAYIGLSVQFFMVQCIEACSVFLDKVCDVTVGDLSSDMLLFIMRLMLMRTGVGICGDGENDIEM